MASPKVILPGSERPAPAVASFAGTPDPNQQVTLTVTVRRRAPIPEIPSKQFTREELAQQFGAAPADLQAVVDYAQSEGLTVIGTDVGTRAVTLSGTLAQTQKAFDAQVGVFQEGTRTFRARTGQLTIPASLADVIEGIFGFDQRKQAHTHYRRRGEGGFSTRAAQAQTSYAPLTVSQAYQYPAANGAGQTIGIVELGGGYSSTDLNNYFAGLGVSPAPTVTAVSVGTGANAPTGDPNGPDGEVLLDIEVAGSIASGANIVVYFGENTTQGFLNAITAAIHDATNNPTVISISWGSAESGYTSQALTAYDQAFQDAKALGVTVCIASGDDGSTDGVSDGQAHVDFPASSPNVLGCGGTFLSYSNGAIQSETVWNEGSGNGASGGGVSENFPIPSYQTNANVPGSVNTGFAGRGVPDVAGDADPASGYNVLIDGQNTVIGGTSAVAPLWAALIAILNQALGHKLGFVNPMLYATPQSFHDITSGNNGAYSAGTGWDACTGLGSPIGSALLQALQASLSPVTPSQPDPSQSTQSPSMSRKSATARGQ
jgi:kumamolisin